MGLSVYESISGRFDDGTPVESVPPAQQALRSIVDNLARLLNTRAGALRHVPDYGLPDLSQVFSGLPRSAEILRQAMATAIARFEPRLQAVRVQVDAGTVDDMALSFLISGCTLAGDGVSISSHFDSDGAAHLAVVPARRRPA